ncbi:TPA: hypothetical protein ENS27_01560 [bacterium]|nr:hypothetical protein [bacterium]
MEKTRIVAKIYLLSKNKGVQSHLYKGEKRTPQLKHFYQTITIFSFILILSISGCGYVTRSESLKHIDSVTISPIANESREYRIEEELGDSIKQEFFRRWSEGSDSIFNATIRNYEVLPLTLGQNNQPEQYRILLDISFVFQDLKRNKIIRDEKNYQKYYDFYVVSGRGKPPEDLKTAKANLIRETAQDIVNSILEEW